MTIILILVFGAISIPWYLAARKLNEKSRELYNVVVVGKTALLWAIWMLGATIVIAFLWFCCVAASSDRQGHASALAMITAGTIFGSAWIGCYAFGPLYLFRKIQRLTNDRGLAILVALYAATLPVVFALSLACIYGAVIAASLWFKDTFMTRRHQVSGTVTHTGTVTVI